MDKTQKLPVCPKPPPRNLKIEISNQQKALPLKKRSVTSAARELFSFLDIVCDEVSFYFVTEKKIAALHERFFQDPSPTDCITFPLDKSHLGEVFLCPAVALQYAKKHKLNPYEELLLYIVHGALHLIGYDDLDMTARRVMRKMEKRCMRHLRTQGISLDPLPS